MKRLPLLIPIAVPILLVLWMFCFCEAAIGAEATISTVKDVIKFGPATASTLTTTSIVMPARTNAVKIVDPSMSGNKVYRLREDSTTNVGNILWEHVTTASTVAMPIADTVRFSVPDSGLYFETNDGTSGTVYLYLR